MVKILKAPSTLTGGHVLLKKYGPKYFSDLQKKRWKKHKEQVKQWEKKTKKSKSSK